MNFFDFIPNIINPYFLNKLDSNVDAAIMLECVKRISTDSADEDGFTFIDLKMFKDMTGLSENKIKTSERFLKKKNLVVTKTEKRIKFYKLNYSEYVKILGIGIKPTIVEKLNHNAKAAFLLSFFIDYSNSQGIPLFSEIPLKEIELLTGLDRKSQIYARDSLLGYKLLDTFYHKNKKQYKLNIDECNRFFNA